MGRARMLGREWGRGPLRAEVVTDSRTGAGTGQELVGSGGQGLAAEGYAGAQSEAKETCEERRERFPGRCFLSPESGTGAALEAASFAADRGRASLTAASAFLAERWRERRRGVSFT